jgi:hypothetical protein
MAYLGPLDWEVAFAIDHGVEWVRKFAHDGAVRREISPRQEIRASVRTLYQFAAVE